MDSWADLVIRGSEDLILSDAPSSDVIVTHHGFPDRLWLDHSAAPSNKQGRATQFKLFGLVHSYGCRSQKVRYNKSWFAYWLLWWKMPFFAVFLPQLWPTQRTSRSQPLHLCVQRQQWTLPIKRMWTLPETLWPLERMQSRGLCPLWASEALVSRTASRC